MTTLTVIEEIVQATVTPTTIAATVAEQVLQVTVQDGATSFLGLNDTPDAYTGQGGKAVAVNGGGTALEFVAFSGGVTDHGALTGLSDDDHAQYHTDARGDARYWPLSTDLATQAELDTHTALTTAAHGGIVPSARTLTINGDTFDLSANRSWTIVGGIDGSGAANQVAFWSDGDTIAGSADLTFNDGAHTLSLSPSSGYGIVRIGGPSGGYPMLCYDFDGVEKWELYHDATGFGIYHTPTSQVRLAVTAAGNVILNHDNPGGRVGIGQPNPQATLHVTSTTAQTATPSNVALYELQSSGTPAAGFGAAVAFQVETDSATGRYVGEFDFVLADPTDVSYKGRGLFYVYDAAGFREGFRIESNGSAPMIGVLGANAAVRQTGGAATAGGTYGATEQAMIQKAYDALRTFGFLT